MLARTCTGILVGGVRLEVSTHPRGLAFRMLVTRMRTVHNVEERCKVITEPKKNKRFAAGIVVPTVKITEDQHRE